MKRILLFTCLLSLFFQYSLAQHQHPHYLDGHLYVKVLDKENRPLRSVEELNRYQKPLEWVDLVQKYQVQSIEPAFPALQGSKLERTYEIRFDRTDKTQAFLRDLAQISYLEYAERVPIARKTLTPDDPFLSNQWFLNNIQALQAHDIHTGGNSVVAIVDDAVRITHEDLAPNLWTNPGEIPNDNIDNDGNGYIDDIHGWDPADLDNDPNPPSTASNSNFTHGTHCAGIVSAATDNSLGIASIGHSVKIMSIKCTYDSASNTRIIYTGYAGVAYAMAAGADVISMSWGGYGSSTTIQNLFDQAHAMGIVLVGAAGNDDTNNAFYPAAYNHVIAVAATGSTDAKASFSNYGNWISVSAPGVSILSTLAGADDSYGYQSGTSMATPLVAGLCGLLKSYNTSATATEINNCILNTADNIDAQNSGYIGELGSGRINALQAINCIAPSAPPIADFSSSKSSICPGQNVQFSDASTNGPNTWLWSIPGASPTSSNQQNPNFSFPNAGTYDVSLIVSNGFGSDTIVQQAYVSVNSNGLTLPFSEDFESGSFATNNWEINNPDNGQTWQIKAAAGTNPGTQAAWMDYYSYSNRGQRDAIMTPALDFSSYSTISLNFEYAYRTYNSNGTDSLLIYVSTDCGVSFPHKVFVGGEDGNNSFATGNISSGPFTPSSPNDWCGGSIGPSCPQIDLSAFAGQSNVIIRFEGYNDYQNNLYLDNIFINGSTNLNAPVANFSADQTQGCAPMQVQFSDLSTGIPSSWNWSFPGGTPSSSSQQSPSVSYTQEGQYDVSLIISNANGSDTLLLPQYIQVDSCAEIVCDSLDNYAAPSNSLYTINGVVGYVSGHNDFLDQAKAEYFANPRNKSYLTALEVAFGKAVSLNPANQFATLQIWDEDGTNGQPGSILGSTSVSIAQIQADIQAGQPTFVQFQTPVSLNAGFYAGVVLNYGQQDTLALLTNNDGQSSMNTAWELWSNNSWHAYDEGASWGLSLSHAITAYTTDRNVQADFSFEPEICAGTSLQLSNNSRDALLYDWTFAGGDSTHSSLENPMITYAQAGTYPIQLQATGECYLQSIAVDSIYVGSIPAIQFSQVQHSTCDLPNGSATVSIDGGTGILSYSWSTIPMQTSATATALSFGQYSISITDEIGCSSIDSVQISTTPPFTSGVNVVSTSCGQDNGTATAMMNGGTAPFSFVWNSQPNQYSQTATDLAPGTYVVQITDSAGCSDQISFNIEASQGPSLQVSAENTSCEEANGSISLGVIDANGPVQYSWSGLPNEQGSSVQGLSAGTYHFTITDSLSCVISDSVSLNNVGEIPQLALGEDQTICDSLYLDASVVDGSSWNWSSGQQTEGIWVSGSGTYAVLVENQAGCVANDTIEITREYLPEQSISILQDASLLLRYQFQVNPSNQASGVSYLWDFGDGNTSQQMNPIYTYIQPGTYVVSLSAINECGQSMEQDSVQILTTSISDIPTLAYALYPNPTKETSLLQWEKQADGILWIYDAQGKLIQQTEIVAQQQEQQLDASKLASGLYFLRLRLGQEEQFIRWVVQP